MPALKAHYNALLFAILCGMTQLTCKCAVLCAYMRIYNEWERKAIAMRIIVRFLAVQPGSAEASKIGITGKPISAGSVALRAL